MTQINRQIPSPQPTAAISEPDALSSGASKEAVPTASDNPTLNSLQDTMHELVNKLEASIAGIMSYMSANTTPTKSVRDMMSKIISDSQSDLAFAGEKCIVEIEELPVGEQAQAVAWWKDLWRQFMEGAVKIFRLIGRGFASIGRGIRDVCVVVWEKVYPVLAGIGRAIAGFITKLASYCGLGGARAHAV